MISEMNFFERIVYILQNYGISYLKGAGTTLLIALVSTAIGCVIGFAVGIVQTIPVDKKRDGIGKRLLLGLVKVILKAYVEIFRGTPMIVQAVFIYFGLSQMCNIQLGMWQAAFLVVSINTGAYMAESVRGGIISVDPGQMEGAKAIGMTHVQAMLKVILPQAFRNIIPQIGSAGVSAVPMAARVSQKVGAEADPTNFLLMHAMGPNVAGVIGTAVAAGTFMAVFGVF